MKVNVAFEVTTYIKKYGRRPVGELLECERDPENASDRYAVAVKKELSMDIRLERHRGSLFLRRGGIYYRMYSNRAQEIFS